MSIALPIHPVTGLRALGIGRRGPIWPQLGGDGTGDGNTGNAGDSGDKGATTGGDEDTGEAGAATGGDTGAGSTEGNAGPGDDGEAGAGGAATGAGGDGEAKPAAKRGGNSTAEDPKVRAARNEAKAAKDEVAALKTAFAKALGLDGDKAETDPKKLADQLATSTREAREKDAELAVYRGVPKDVDAQALLDSRAFVKDLHKLDPAADDFDEQRDALISKYAEKNPSKFKIAPAAPAAPKPPARSGGDTTGGSGENGGQLSYEQYKALPREERMKAVREGRANTILGRK